MDRSTLAGVISIGGGLLVITGITFDEHSFTACGAGLLIAAIWIAVRGARR